MRSDDGADDASEDLDAALRSLQAFTAKVRGEGRRRATGSMGLLGGWCLATP